MRRLLLVFVLLALAAAQETPPAGVAGAVERATAWLRAQQAGDGSWGGLKTNPKVKTYRFPAGLTALSLYALLANGAAADEERLGRGFDYLESYYRVPDSNYEVSVLVLALAERVRRRGGDGKPRFGRKERAWMKDLVDALAAGWKAGGWRYGKAVADPDGIDKDLAHTQLAITALYAAHTLGLPVSRDVVRGTVEWTLAQQEEGALARGWAYARGSPVDYERRITGNMTAGAIVVLQLGDAMLEDLDPRALRKLKKPMGIAVADGLAWLDVHWTVERNPPADQATMYHTMYLWGLARIGARMGERIGTHAWYAEGAAWLVAHQSEKGFWDSDDTHEPSDLISTCFALLFLASPPG